MKLGYYLGYQMSKDDSKYKKLIQQLDEWKRNNHTCQLFVLTKENSDFDSISNFNKSEYLTNLRGVECCVLSYKNVFDRYFKLCLMIYFILKWSPEILYSRHDISFSINRLILSRLTKLVIEINTDDINEYTCFYRIWTKPIFLFYRRLLFSHIVGAVIVTFELQNSKSYLKIKSKSVVISNGTKINGAQILPVPFNEEPVFSFIGTSNYTWHGIDKILKLAEILSNYKFYIIGPKAEEYGSLIPDNVIFTGFLTKSEYIKYLSKTDIAIGTLALHRKGMDEACPLKVREYLQFGLPLILGCQDTDFMEGADFILQLPNSENNVEPHIKKIENFIEYWVNRRVSRDLISHLDVSFKERERLFFFETTL